MATGYVIADTTNNAGTTSIDTSCTLAVGVLGKVTNVDLKTIAQTTLYTVPAASAGCVVTDVILMITSADAATIGPTLSVGVSPSYNEWLSSTALTTYTGLYTVKMLNLITDDRAPLAFGPTDVIKLNITVGATATALRATIVTLGYNL